MHHGPPMIDPTLEPPCRLVSVRHPPRSPSPATRSSCRARRLKIDGKPTGAGTFIVGEGDVNVFNYQTTSFNYQLNTAYASNIKKADDSDWTGYSFGFSELIKCTCTSKG